MAETSQLSTLLKMQPAPARAGNRAANPGGRDFNVAFNSAYSERSREPRAADLARPANEVTGNRTERQGTGADSSAREPARGADEPRRSSDQAHSRPADNKAPDRAPDNTQDKAARAPVDEGEPGPDRVGEDWRASLSEPQRAALDALPEDQVAALESLEPERRGELLSFMLDQKAMLGSLSPELAESLAELTEAQRQQLQGLLNQLAKVFSKNATLEQTLSEAGRLIDQTALGDELKEQLHRQMNALVQSQQEAPEAAIKGTLAQFVAGVQLSAAQQRQGKQSQMPTESPTPHGTTPVAGEGQSSPSTATDSVKEGLRSDGGKSENELKPSVVRLNPDALAQGALKERLESAQLNDAAKLHNLFSARAETGDRNGAQSAAALAQLTATQSSAANAVKAPLTTQSQVPVPFQQPGWGEAVGQKVVWMSQQNIKSAELRLDPPELGPLQVKVSVQNDQTQITFTSSHSVVREVLDQNAFRLREMLAEQGMGQVDVDVSDQREQAQSEQLDDDEQPGQSASSAAEGDLAQQDESDDNAQSAVVQLIDHYA